jgi:transposase
VYHTIVPTRGKAVPTEFLAGATPKVWLSDRLAAQGKHAAAHQYCLAHLIRDAQYAIDAGDTVFAPAFKRFLKSTCAIGRRRDDLADTTIKAYERKLHRELDRLLDLRVTNTASQHDRRWPRQAACVHDAPRRRADQQRQRTGIAPLGHIPESDEWFSLELGCQGLR